MADTKITALAPIGAIDPANDVLPIVDVSNNSMAASGTTCRVTTNQLLQANAIASLASATITGDLTVDTSTLKVDSANNRVGVLNAAPNDTFTIASDNYLSFQTASTGFNSGRAARIGAISAGSGNGYLVFETYQGGSGGAERYRIASDGVATWSNVGGGAGTAMTLNSTGLGVGVTPSAWPAASKAIDVDSYGANYAIAAATQVGISRNCYYNGTNWIYKLTTSAQRFEQDNGGGFKWFTAAAGTAGTAVTFTQSMTLESTGSLVLGAAAVATTATDGFLYIPGCAGTPTGTPTAKTGRVPLVVDTTNNKLYFYSGGAWVAAN